MLSVMITNAKTVFWIDVAGVTSVGLDGLADLSGKDWQVCALTLAGAVKCRGSNKDGQLGDGSFNFRLPANGLNDNDEIFRDGFETPGSWPVGTQTLGSDCGGIGGLRTGSSTVRGLPLRRVHRTERKGWRFDPKPCCRWIRRDHPRARKVGCASGTR